MTKRSAASKTWRSNPPDQERLNICTVCGEIYDVDAPVEAAHHRQAEHAALLLPLCWFEERVK
jgi:hypothetical protein